MKILTLRFTNLNSLRGESPVIDFTQAPLAGAGLFAITGPTGAGKTTLLDAITLALYGRAARYGAMPNPELMMSRHTGECSAEVEFQCEKGIYRSSWHLRRARGKVDGRIQNAERRVTEAASGTVITQKIEESNQKIVELTGLNYERFLRSVMLAQGEFAAFLKAEPNERTELLQQVTGTHVYADISRFAYQQAVDAKRVFEDLRLRQDAVVLMTAEERAERLEKIGAISQKLVAVALSLQALKKRLEEAQAHLKCRAEADDLATEGETLEAAQAAFADAAAKLKRHQRALPLQGAFSDWKNCDEDLLQRQALQADLENSLPVLRDRVECAQKEVGAATEHLKAALAEEVTLRPLLREITALDTELKSLARALAEASTAQAQTTGRVQAAQREIATAQAKQAAVQGELAELQVWQENHTADASLHEALVAITSALGLWSEKQAQVLVVAQEQVKLASAFEDQQMTAKALSSEVLTHAALHEKVAYSAAAAQESLAALLEKDTVDECETRREVMQRELQKFEGLQRLSEQIAIGEETRSKQQAHLEAARLDLAKIKTEGEHQRDMEKQSRSLVDALRKNLELADRVQSLEEQRSSLEEGQPCPLCGSTEHPFADPHRAPKEEMVQLRKDVAQAERDLEKASARRLALLETYGGVNADIKGTEKALSELTANLATSSKQWEATAESLAFTKSSHLPDLLVEKQAGYAHLTQRLQNIRGAESQLVRAKEAAAKAERDWQQKHAEHDKALALATQTRQALDAMTVKHGNASQDASHAAVQFQTLLSPFAEFAEALPDGSKAMKRLEKRRAGWLDKADQSRKLTAEIAQLKASLREKGAQLEALQIEASERLIAETAAQVELEKSQQMRREKFGERSVTSEEKQMETKLATMRAAHQKAEVSQQQAQTHWNNAEARFRDDAATIQGLVVKHAALEKALSAAVLQAGFIDREDAATAFQDADRTRVWEQQQAELTSRMVTLQTRQKALEQSRAALPAEAAEDAVKMDELEVVNQTMQGEHTSLVGEQAVLNEQLRKDEEDRVKHANMAGEIERAGRDRQRWGRLGDLIGSAQGTVFAKFAQGLTLERLVSHANRHLAELNPRYALRRDHLNAEDLELEIVDHYQADTARSMQSLSGGESFLASLALALGLSELAGGRSRIDSLFIDEGFGTLDPDTLETAMAALENLRTGGKSIGVISHVDALKERITTQIRVSKLDGGCSKIEVVG